MTQNSQRSSNIELMRIVVMAAIIAHHYVVNSSVKELYDIAAYPAQTYFLQMWGLFGKAGINAFMLISGYYMCNSKMTPLRYLKVLVPIVLYGFFKLFARVATGMSRFSKRAVANIVLNLLTNAGNNGSFLASIAVFYLLMPVLISIVGSISKETHFNIVISTVALQTGLSTFFNNTHLFNEVSWFCVLFFIAAYIRNYPSEWMENRKIVTGLLLASILLTALSVVVIDLRFPKESPYLYVNTPAKLGAFSIGVSTFLFFRILPVPQSKPINLVAAHMFGVLLFHANPIGRKYLWQPGGLFDTQAAFMSSMPNLVLNSVLAVVFVLAVGTLFDAIIAAPIENLFYKWFAKHEDAIIGWFKRDKLPQGQ